MTRVNKPYAVVFAGVPGSSKSIIAHYLSEQFGLPIFSSDVIRSEVKEDLLTSDINEPQVTKEFERRLASRRAEILTTQRPVIFDSSVDRRWPEVRSLLGEASYDWFLISLDLSRDFMVNLFTRTIRQKGLQELDIYLKHHQKFLDEYSPDVALHINDAAFANRLEISAQALKRFTGL